MKILLTGLTRDDELAQALAEFDKTEEMRLVDLRRTREKKNVGYRDDGLPIYHSFDVLHELCTWEEALYETKIDGLMAVYPPPLDAELPPFDGVGQLADLPGLLLLADAYTVGRLPEMEYDQMLWIGQNAPAHFTSTELSKLGAFFRGGTKPGFFAALFERWKGKSHDRN